MTTVNPLEAGREPLDADSSLIQIADRSLLLLARPGPDIREVTQGLIDDDMLVLPVSSVEEIHALEPRPSYALVEATIPGALEWLTRWLAGHRECLAVGVVPLTGRPLAALRAGVSCVLPRPFDVEEVRRAVAQLRRIRTLTVSVAEYRDRDRFEVSAPVLEGVLATVGHEIRNPLAVALANVEFLRDSEGGSACGMAVEERDSVLDDTQLALKRIRDLIETVSTLISGNVPILAGVDVYQTARAAVSALPTRALRIEVRGVPGVMARAHAPLLTQVLSGLLQNAVDATRAVEEPHVGVHVYRSETEARVTVRDNAPALTAEEKARVFEPRFSTGVNRGTGLGLSLMRHAMARMGGTITMADDGGRGRAFRVRLALAER